MTGALAFAAQGDTAMSEYRDTDSRTVERSHDNLNPAQMRDIERRMRLWEMANGAICALFLWAPMAAAAFQRTA